MYTSTNKFPQFKGKNKNFANECIKFVFKKEPQLTQSFVYAILVAVAFSIAYTFSVEVFSVPAFVKEHETIINAIIVGIGFYVFILIYINIYIHPAVNRHIEEFESQNRNV